MLITTKDVPFTDGSKLALRHEGHALNVTFGSLQVFATYNFADSYSAVLFKLLKHDEEPSGSHPCSAEELGELRFELGPDAPEMPTTKGRFSIIIGGKCVALRKQGVAVSAPSRHEPPSRIRNTHMQTQTHAQTQTKQQTMEPNAKRNFKNETKKPSLRINHR